MGDSFRRRRSDARSFLVWQGLVWKMVCQAKGGTFVTGSRPDGAADGSTEKLPSFDVSAPSPARMWNYWVGGYFLYA
jgi:hypothetical protein